MWKFILKKCKKCIHFTSESTFYIPLCLYFSSEESPDLRVLIYGRVISFYWGLVGRTEICKWVRRLNVLADASKRFEVEMCHVFGEDLMVNSIFFCHFEQTNPWIPLPSCASPLESSPTVLQGCVRLSHRMVAAVRWVHHHHHPTLLSFTKASI